MKFAGFIKNSFVDYPEEISAVVFTLGCNFDCWYCHNRKLIGFDKKLEIYDEEQILNFLKDRIGLIDGLVITGGEPTLHLQIKDFIKKVKVLGFKVKLDTNGTNPKFLKELLDEKLLDFVAMDIKTSLAKYEELVNKKVDLQALKKSVNLLINSNINYEFRTTFSPDVTVEDVEQISKTIKGAKSYAIQRYNPQQNKKIEGTHSLEDFINALKIAKKNVPNSFLRSLD